KLGNDHPNVAQSLLNLANIYNVQGRSAQAAAYILRALAIQEAKLGRDHPDVALTLNNLATLFLQQRRYAEADKYFAGALAIQEAKLGRDHPNLALPLNNMAIMYYEQGKHAPAQAHLQRSLAIQEAKLGRDHPELARVLGNLAAVHRDQGRSAEAEAHLRRALTLRETGLGREHPDVASTLFNLATLHRDNGKIREALDFARRTSNVVIGHAATQSDGAKPRDGVRELVEQKSNYFRAHVTVLHAASAQRIEPDAALAREGFEIAQWAEQSAAAVALEQMAARQAKGAGPLAQAARERQDFERQWRELDRRLIEAVGKGDSTLATALRGELSGVSGKIIAIDTRLAREFPDYAALVQSKPLSIAAAQALLGTDEALFFSTGTSKGSFAWLVTRTDARWVKLALTEREIAAQVQTLRCGLDRDGEWSLSGDNRWTAKKEACRKLAPAGGLAADASPPFDITTAHALYDGLFGPFKDMIQGRHLLVVPTGALASLPLQVLVAEKPAAPVEASANYSAIAWLGSRHALTMLPSVASLKALRQHAKGTAAPKPYAGIGNPLLLGQDGNDVSAASKQTCATGRTTPLKVATRTALGADADKLSAGGRVDLALLRNQAPLPETADELCDVGRSLAADPADILLGARATERALKSLSASGALASYRVLHFATHGLLPQETASFAAGLTEAALLLTPPDKAGDEDDGLLTASEVTLLKLNADWVIMSACNTGGGDKSGEALSGLARAFFYAGARALLVSHWYVDSAAAVALTTRTFDEMKRERKLGRAEALRRSMQVLIASGGRFAHPAYWAPFVVVGEGAAR
ncbi:MAG: tetratricopeptide repeat protein, partial [Pseudorhodoplanes sp.]